MFFCTQQAHNQGCDTPVYFALKVVWGFLQMIKSLLEIFLFSLHVTCAVRQYSPFRFAFTVMPSTD